MSGGAVYGLLHWRMAKMEKALAVAVERKDEKLAAYIASQLSILRNGNLCRARRGKGTAAGY